ncbi:hypothetical protein AB0J38_14435 [Streptomyces sp. NPDC050095]|uniref:hypothetical protein n=1 Tax=unclassified Streptomyces TaxID=2593676 RepID=UPI003438BE20
MADEVSFNPDLFRTNDAGDLELNAVERAWPYTGVSLSQGNGLKYDEQGLFVDLPPTVSCLGQVWNAADGPGAVDIAAGAQATLAIPDVTAPGPVTQRTAVFGGWHVTCWYRLDPAATDTGYLTVALSNNALPLDDRLVSSGTLRGPIDVATAFIPIDDVIDAGATFTTAVKCDLDNQTGGPVTVDFRARFAAYLLEGITDA